MEEKIKSNKTKIKFERRLRKSKYKNAEERVNADRQSKLNYYYKNRDKILESQKNLREEKDRIYDLYKKGDLLVKTLKTENKEKCKIKNDDDKFKSNEHQKKYQKKYM